MTDLNTQAVVEVEENVEAKETFKALAKVAGFTVYKFDSQEAADSVKALLTEETLADNVFKGCQKYDAFKTGFTPFLGEDDNYLLQANGVTVFQISTQEKRPHTPTVKKLCKLEEAKYMKENDVAKLDKESKDIIKMGVIDGLLPTTTPDEEKTVLLWLTGEYLVVGCPTLKKGEDYVATVRSAVGSLPVTPLTVDADVTEKMTEWLRKGYAEKLMLGEKVELTHADPDKKGVISFSKESLYYVEVKKLLDEGCLVNKIQLSNEDRVLFTMNAELEFSGLTVAKDVLCGAKDIGALLVTVGEINKTVAEVVSVFSE